MDTSIIPQKQCTKCKQFFDATTEYFYRASSNKTCGLKPHCKTCGRENAKQWRDEHPEEHRRYCRQFAIDHPEYAKEQTKKSQAKDYAANPEKYKIRRHNEYHKDIGRSRKRLRDWRLRNSDSALRSSHQSHEKRREADRIYAIEYAKQNPLKRRANEAKRRALKRNSTGQYSELDVIKMYNAQFGQCAYCGISLNKYHVDHIKPLSRGGSNDPDNICIACPRCNLSKNDSLLEDWIKVRGW